LSTVGYYIIFTTVMLYFFRQLDASFLHVALQYFASFLLFELNLPLQQRQLKALTTRGCNALGLWRAASLLQVRLQYFRLGAIGFTNGCVQNKQ
jgi:hypothetical protein